MKEQGKPALLFNEETINLIDSWEKGFIIVDEDNKVIPLRPGITGKILDKSEVPKILLKKILGVDLDAGDKIESAHYRYWVKLAKILFNTKTINMSVISKINREENYIFRGAIDFGKLTPKEIGLLERLGLVEGRYMDGEMAKKFAAYSTRSEYKKSTGFDYPKAAPKGKQILKSEDEDND